MFEAHHQTSRHRGPAKYQSTASPQRIRGIRGILRQPSIFKLNPPTSEQCSPAKQSAADGFTMPAAPRFNWTAEIPVKLFKSLDALLRDPHEMPYEEFGFDDNLEWDYVRHIHIREPLLTFEKKPELVMGVDVRDSTQYASTPVVVGGNTSDVPLVVRACVEILLQTGCRQGLVVDAPNEKRCDELASIYDHGPHYGRGFHLEGEATADIFQLLSNYIETLPIALIHPAFFRSFYRWCVIPTHIRNLECQAIKDQYEEKYQAKVREAELHKWRMPVRTVRRIVVENIETQEGKQVAVAVLLLRMLPPAPLALIVYLMDFLLDLCTYFRYGMTPVDVVKKFANKVVRGLNTKESEAIMIWLLTRWPEISEAMFKKSRAAYEELVKKSREEYDAVKPVSPPDTASQQSPPQTKSLPSCSSNPRDIATRKDSVALWERLHTQAQDLHARNADLATQKTQAHDVMGSVTNMPREEIARLVGRMQRIEIEKDEICLEMANVHDMLETVEGRLTQTSV